MAKVLWFFSVRIGSLDYDELNKKRRCHIWVNPHELYSFHEFFNGISKKSVYVSWKLSLQCIMKTQKQNFGI